MYLFHSLWSLISNLSKDIMKLFPDETFLVYKTRLVGDVFLLMYWDLDNRGRPECIWQFLRIWKANPLPLKTPLLIIRPPIIKGIYAKRELISIINEETEKKRAYLDRMGEKLRRQIETLLLTNKLSTEEENRSKSEAFRRLLFLIRFILWRDGWEEGTEEKKRPP